MATNPLGPAQSDSALDDPVEQACLDRREMQFVYQDGDGCIFMDTDSDEQIALSRDLVGELPLYLKEGSRAHVVFYAGKPLGLEAPTIVELVVADTEPPAAGANEARHKPATLETGLRLMIPSPVRVGETIAVDTRNGAYLGRATRREIAD
jgi:elongation factor P